MIDIFLEFFIYAIFPYFKRKKRKKEEWYGVVEEKRIEGDYSLKKHMHVVVFRTGEGQKRKQYHKRSGEDFPDPVS